MGRSSSENGGPVPGDGPVSGNGSIPSNGSLNGYTNGSDPYSMLDTLADAAIFGRSVAEDRELSLAVEAVGESELEALEAAAAVLASRHVEYEPMPASLRGRCFKAVLEAAQPGSVEPDSAQLNAAIAGQIAGDQSQTSVPSTNGVRSNGDHVSSDRANGVSTNGAALNPIPDRFAAADQRPLTFGVEPKASPSGFSPAWLAAAAAVVLGAAGWYQAIVAPASTLSEAAVALVDARDEMIDAGAAVMEWSAWTDAAVSAFGDVEGTVVWDAAAKDGYMTFKNLPANNPETTRYQLWIVDADRGAPLTVPPVDGGVFDVPAGETEVVVRIDPKLSVGNAAAFAVTLEGPEGAVVSERRPDQLVVIATDG
ncbi:MAG: anti-sigma factor [Planctomycetota bacterium]